MARQARKPDPIDTPPPSADEVANMAASGVDVNRGSSDQMPLSDVGKSQAQQTADKLTQKGGFDQMVVSPATRTVESAGPLAKANPAMQVRAEPALESWAQGNLEGQPKATVQSAIQDLIRKQPRRVIPGQGAITSKPGESFDNFRGRALPAVRGIMQELAQGIQQNPDHRIAVPVHSQVIKLVKAWIKNGAPDDFSIDPREMDKDSEAPGQVERLFPNQDGDWELTPVDLDNSEQLGPGAYMIRHGLTPQNKESYERAGQQQQALAKLSDRTQALDFPQVNKHARALSKLGMSDEDISKYIDAALPSPEQTAGLPMPQALAVAAAASHAKKPQYEPILQSHFGNISALPPDLQQQFAAHLDAIRNS